jgi:pilus assembly protein CpaE
LQGRVVGIPSDAIKEGGWSMKKRILIVDDDIEALKLVGLVLERAGHEIVVAMSGEQALDRARAQEPDLVVLDIAMPGMDGFEVSRRLRTSPETADVPILMFTARGAVQDKVSGFDAGANDYVTKPIHPQELESRVQALLLRSPRDHPREGMAPLNAVGFVGAKGGVGTTTLAVNTAVVLAQGRAGERRVALAEARSGMATAAFQLGLPSQHTIGNILDRPMAAIDADLVEAQIEQHSTGLLVLAGQREPVGVAKQISPGECEIIARHLGAIADYVLLDLGVGLDAVNRRILPRCAHIVVTIGPNPITLTLAESLLEEITESLDIPPDKISLAMVSRSRSSASFTRDAIEERLGHSLRGLIPPAPELAFQSASQAKPIVMTYADSFVVQQYRRFAEKLIEVLPSPGS